MSDISASSEVSNFDPSMQDAVRQLREQYPRAPFLTLGQTVLWDEPMKAAFCRVLEILAPDAQIVAGVHDTDYFAKLSHHDASDQKFVLLPHNDGDTRDLWSAAGEISALFGSETVPTRHKLADNGVAFDRVAREYPGGAQQLLNDETNAWGWRAIVHTEPRPLLAGEVKLQDIAPALREQLQWAFDKSLHCLGAKSTSEAEADANCSCPQPCESREVAARIGRWVEEYSAANPDATLSDLYRNLTPRLWAMVRGEGSCNLQTTHSLKLFRFNRETVHYPRFKFLQIFLDPATRQIAKKCYDDAVRGSGIYTLDQFGATALPFDVVLPGRGRGTLSIDSKSITIATEPPLRLQVDNCDSIEKLAATLEDLFGNEVAIVGKAVTLISMLANELIFVFHENASRYTRFTQQMNAALRDNGIELNLHPLLRIQYSTWDSLSNVDSSFALPLHLASAFGSETVSARDFASRWKEVCDEQDKLLEALRAARAPRDAMQIFAASSNEWRVKAEEYSQARAVISELSRQARCLQSQTETLREEATQLKIRASELEKHKGEKFRAEQLPLLRRIGDIKETAFARLNERDGNGVPRKLSKEERAERAEAETLEAAEIEELRARIAELQIVRAAADQQIEALRSEARSTLARARALVEERVVKERSGEAVAARALISRIEYETELEKLRRVRDAMITSESLCYTNLRPTAWWLPLVSPDGKWFESIVQTTKARIEDI